MKKAVIGMFVLGLTSLGFSQESDEAFSTVELKAVTVSPTNVDYLYAVRDENTPAVVKELQEKAAAYDITSSAAFDKKIKKPFEVVFKASNGDIIAYYDRDGEILAAHENFKNVTLPLEVREKAFQEHDGWVMSSNRYASNYQDNVMVNKEYRIKLRNGNLQKKVVIDLQQNK